MARITPAIKVKIFNKLNENGIPWADSKFVISEGEAVCLGSGNFSDVYLMEDTVKTDTFYAVKIIGFKENRRIHKSDFDSYKKEAVLQGGLALRCETVAKIVDKAVISIKLSDSGIVEAVQADEAGVDKPGWLALVAIKMEKLDSIIDENLTGDHYFKLDLLKDIDDRTALNFSIDLAEALYTSHKENIMHRDVKLENVFYDANTGSFKLGDFGIARITNLGSASTKGAGTLGYEAPEVEVEGGGSSKYNFKADIYSFGVTVYLLLNNLKFPGSDGYHVKREIQYNPNGKIEKPEKGLPELQDLVLKTMQYKPEYRPESMESILYELYGILDKYYGEADEIVDDVQSVAESVSQDIIDSNANEEKVFVEEITVQTEEKVVQIENNNETLVSMDSIITNKESNNSTENYSIDSSKKEIDKTIENSSISQTSDIGTVVAEVNKDVSDGSNNDKKTSVYESTVVSKPYKGILGSILLFVGSTFMELIIANENTKSYGLFNWILVIAVAIVSLYSLFVNKIQKKDMKFTIINVLLFWFSIFVMFKEGMVWPVILLTIALILGGITELTVLAVNALLYPVILSIKLSGIVLPFCNQEIVFVFLFAIILGLFWLIQYDSLPLCGDSILMVMFGFLLIVIGLILGFLKLITVLDASSLIVNMHILYVGLAFFVIGCIQYGKESKTEGK